MITSQPIIKTPKQTVSAEKIKKNWQIIVQQEARLRRIVAKWDLPCRDDLYSATCELFAIRCHGKPDQIGQIVTSFRLLVNSNAHAMFQRQGREVPLDQAPDQAVQEAEDQDLAGAMGEILGFCKKHGLKHLYRAVIAVKTRGCTMPAAAQEIGVSPQRLSNELSWLGRKWGGEGGKPRTQRICRCLPGRQGVWHEQDGRFAVFGGAPGYRHRAGLAGGGERLARRISHFLPRCTTS